MCVRHQSIPHTFSFIRKMCVIFYLYMFGCSVYVYCTTVLLQWTWIIRFAELVCLYLVDLGGMQCFSDFERLRNYLLVFVFNNIFPHSSAHLEYSRMKNAATAPHRQIKAVHDFVIKKYLYYYYYSYFIVFLHCLNILRLFPSTHLLRSMECRKTGDYCYHL